MVKGSVRICVSQKLRLLLPSIVFEKSGVSDCIDMGMPRRSIGGFLEMGVVTGGVSGVGKVEVFGLIKGFVDG